MNVAQDPLLPTLNECVHTPLAVATVAETLRRVIQQLDASTGLMAWEVVSLDVFGEGLPESIRSCWIFVIRAGAATGAERHPNSQQRSLSLAGSGIFKLREAQGWTTHRLVSEPSAAIEQRWVTIPPATWHRLSVDKRAWGMLSFHTVAPEELIEERPVDPNDLDGQTHQERYAGRR